MADNVRMGAGGVPYKAKSEPKEEVISEVLTVNPNKAKEEKKSKKEWRKIWFRNSQWNNRRAFKKKTKIRLNYFSWRRGTF